MYYSDNLLKIKKESLALRCDVCHQMDCFDPIRNYCSRCEFVSIQENKIKEVSISSGSYLLYLLLNLSITAISYELLQTFHPILAHEKSTIFFLPMTSITIFLFLFNYRYLVNKATLDRQIGVFYLTFLTALLAYGIYLFAYLQTPIIKMEGLLFCIFITMAFGHIFGLPTLIFMVFINNCLRKSLFGEILTHKFFVKR